MTKNAQGLVNLICKEHKLQLDRVAGGHISPDQVEVCLRERLIAIGKRNPAMKRLLLDWGPIPKEDDDDPTKPWAEDKRDDSFHEVRTGTQDPVGLKKSALRLEDEVDHPLPGERVC